MIRNNIETIAPDAFRQLRLLQTLYLDGNQIKILQAEMFQHMASVRTLSLKSNQITYINQGTLQSLRHIEKLSFENCFLERIHPRAFEGLDNLVELNLVNNELKRLDPLMGRYLPVSLNVFRLYRNPWVCDCHLRWLRNWVSAQGKNWDFITNTPACTAPELLHSIEWKELQPDQFACPSSIHLNNGTSFHLKPRADMDIECIVYGDPRPVIQWKRGKGNVKHEVTERIATSEHGDIHVVSVLHVKDANEEDAGDYKCIAHNLAGNSEVTFKLWFQAAGTGENTDKANNSSATLVGVVVAVILVVLGVAVLVAILYFRIRNRQRQAYKPPEANHKVENPPNPVANSNNTTSRGADTPIITSAKPDLHVDVYTREEEIDAEIKENNKNLVTDRTGLLSNRQDDHIEERQGNHVSPAAKPKHKTAEQPKKSPTADLTPEPFKIKVFCPAVDKKVPCGSSDDEPHKHDKRNMKKEGSASHSKEAQQPPKVQSPIVESNPGACGPGSSGKVPDLVSGNKHAVSKPVPPPQVPCSPVQTTSHKRAENPYAKPSELRPGVAPSSKSSRPGGEARTGGRSDRHKDTGGSDLRSADSSDSDSTRQQKSAHSPSPTRHSSTEHKQLPKPAKDLSPCTNPVCLKDHQHAAGKPGATGHSNASSSNTLPRKQHIKSSHSTGGLDEKAHRNKDKPEQESPYGTHKDPGHYRTLPSRPKGENHRDPGGSSSDTLCGRTIRMLPSLDEHSLPPNKTSRMVPGSSVTLSPQTRHRGTGRPQSGPPPGQSRQLPSIIRSPGAPEPQIHGFRPGQPVGPLPPHMRNKAASPTKPLSEGGTPPHGSPRAKTAWAHTTASLDDILSPPFGPVKPEKPKSPRQTRTSSKIPKPGESDEYGTAV